MQKPVGGVSLFGDNPNIFQPKIPKQQPENTGKVEPTNKPLSLFDNSSEDEEIFLPIKPKKQETIKKSNLLFDDSEDEPVEIVKPKPATKKISLFDDDDDLLKEEEDLFASVNKKNTLIEAKSTKGLFDDIEPPKILREESSKPGKGLFDDLESSNDAADDMFMPTSNKKTQNKSTKSLFDDLDSDSLFSPETVKPAPKKKSLFEDLENLNSAEEDLFSVYTENKPTPKELVEEKTPKSLFDDLESTNSAEDEENSRKPTSNKELPIKVEQGITESLFDDLESSDSVKDDLFTIKTKTPLEVNNSAGNVTTKEETKDIQSDNTKTSEKDDLFDDSDAEKCLEDLFNKPVETKKFSSSVSKDNEDATEPLRKNVSFDDDLFHPERKETAKVEEESDKDGKEDELATRVGTLRIYIFFSRIVLRVFANCKNNFNEPQFLTSVHALIIIILIFQM